MPVDCLHLIIEQKTGVFVFWYAELGSVVYFWHRIGWKRSFSSSLCRGGHYYGRDIWLFLFSLPFFNVFIFFTLYLALSCFRCLGWYIIGECLICRIQGSKGRGKKSDGWERLQQCCFKLWYNEWFDECRITPIMER